MNNEMKDNFHTVMNEEIILFNRTYQVSIKRYIQEIFSDSEKVLDWVTKMLDYNVSNGKRNRGLSVVSTYRFLTSPVKQGPGDMEDVRILGWVVELSQSMILIFDDIMDESETRRGQLCWYKKPHIGLKAINDELLIYSIIFEILRRHFSQKTYYKYVLDVMTQLMTKTTTGECFDLMMTPDDNQMDKWELFTEQNYLKMIQNKTAYYSFSLPIRFAMYVAGLCEPQIHEDCEKALLKIGCLFQMQDDYIDCFGDPKVTGKIGMDIVDGKCTWLIVKAVQLANEKQLEVLNANYGRKNKHNEEIVKSTFKLLDLKTIFSQYEQSMMQEINDLIKTVVTRHSLPKSMFDWVLGKLYQRNK